MVLNAASAARWVRLSTAEVTALESPERPIVLLEKRDGFDDALPGWRPGWTKRA